MQLIPLDIDHLPKTLSWINNPRITEPFLYFPGTITEKQNREWFERMQEDPSQIIFAIQVSGAGHIGNLGFKHLDPIQKSGEIWVYIGNESEQGKGYGSAAVALGRQHAVSQLGLEQVVLHVRADHPAAIRIYEKAGFTHSGTRTEKSEFSKHDVEVLRMRYLKPGKPD